ncbi:Zn(2)-C6 fungal-type DNA-binding domain protein [Niveomyces insectorum RCEF 264]|uniref:Zn(2)-C6 fungal-type DNA-binding domain protein n=1 Tax=Niveomyces insectorum RCEF 264 TaxID=1081102 RepID=A0A162IAX0_9HYPO|nr:Zn(2)-C6 fungal-type DNA-binding domain protein [Niveomyces insectorum RCEF 264]
MRDATFSGTSEGVTRSRTTGSSDRDDNGEDAHDEEPVPATKRRRLSNGPSLRKRRTVLACDVCRSRRTKCDGARPLCSYCKSAGTECTYRPIQEPPPSRLETEITTIRKHLEQIEGLILKSTVAPEYVRASSTNGQDQQLQLQQHDTRTSSSCHASRNYSDADGCRGSTANSQGPGQEPPGFNDIPVMVVKDASFLRLAGFSESEAGRFANTLVANERAAWAARHHQQQRPRMFVLQQHRALEALDAFYEHVHSWFPILSPRFRETYLAVMSGALPPATESCLALIVTAIGCLPDAAGLAASSSSPPSSSMARPDLSYANAALEMLPVVLAECSITAVQCLLTLSLYYCCTVQPMQAYDYVLIASLKIQTHLKTQPCTETPGDMEPALRAYWAILIVEHEIANQIDLPSSRIWDLDDTTPLPSSYLESWPQPQPSPAAVVCSPPVPWSSSVLPRVSDHGPPPPPSLSPQEAAALLQQPPWMMTSPGSSTTTTTADTTHNRSTAGPAPAMPDEIEFFYLAEIAMRRMLHRCTTSTRRHPVTHVPVYAPLIATELIDQLERWHGHLPACLRFDPVSTDHNDDDDDDDDNDAAHFFARIAPPSSPHAAFLETQYYSCKASIYWPAAFQAIRHGHGLGDGDASGEADGSDIRIGVARFFKAYGLFMVSAAVSVQRCRPYTWILYTSIFALTLAAWCTTTSLSPSSPSSSFSVTNGPSRRRASSLPYNEKKTRYCFGLALQVFDDMAGTSPSLDSMGQVLRDKLDSGAGADISS